MVYSTATRALQAETLQHLSAMRAGWGEQGDRRLWRIKGAERVAGVGVQRRRTAAKAHTGHPNRMQRRAALVREQPAFSASPRRLFGYFLAETRKYRPRQGPALAILYTDYLLRERIATPVTTSHWFAMTW